MKVPSINLTGVSTTNYGYIGLDLHGISEPTHIITQSSLVTYTTHFQTGTSTTVREQL